MELVRRRRKSERNLGADRARRRLGRVARWKQPAALRYDYSPSHCDTFLTESGKEVLDKDSKDS
jgi:hypothetical protein